MNTNEIDCYLQEQDYLPHQHNCILPCRLEPDDGNDHVLYGLFAPVYLDHGVAFPYFSRKVAISDT